MNNSDREPSGPSQSADSLRLSLKQSQQPSRFRACVAQDLLPSDQVPAPSPRGERWGQGPLDDRALLQLGAAPKQQRRRRPH